MITITSEAADQLRTMEIDGNPAKLEFNAEEDGQGGYNCTVALVGSSPDGAAMELIDGIMISWRGMANAVFAGAVVGLNQQGELMLEMPESESCGEDGCSCGGSCGCGH